MLKLILSNEIKILHCVLCDEATLGLWQDGILRIDVIECCPTVMTHSHSILSGSLNLLDWKWNISSISLTRAILKTPVTYKIWLWHGKCQPIAVILVHSTSIHLDPFHFPYSLTCNSKCLNPPVLVNLCYGSDFGKMKLTQHQNAIVQLATLLCNQDSSLGCRVTGMSGRPWVQCKLCSFGLDLLLI